MSQGPTGFVADVALRLEPLPARRNLARLLVAALLALLIEGGAFFVVWRERNFVPAPAPEEIPVEVVVEPPPPPSPPPEAAPTPEPSPTPTPELKSPDDEKPATDAPREGKSDHDDDHVGDKEKPAAPPSSEATPSPTPTQPAASPEPTPSAAAPPPPSPEPAPTVATPDETTAPEAPKTEPTETPQPKPTEETKPAPKSAAVAALEKSLSDVPDVDFGGVAVQSEITGGNAKATYLSKVFGLVQSHFRVPPLARAYGRVLVGRLELVIDARGRIVQRYVSEPSGSMELDEAAMQAVAAVARSFPPPPMRQTVGIYWQYSSSN